jgi:tRNA pseudouridine38-40 synthase
MLLGNGQVVDTINSNLPEQIRVLGVKRTTKGFDSKNTCDSRTYSYIMPTFAFAPVETLVTEDYRITEEVRERVGEILSMFKGTHNFHNFTSGKKPNDPSAKRYIMQFTIGEPFIRNGLEFVKLTVRGQSFMLHQIRKMIGLTIAIMRGMTGVELIERSWGAEKTDVPKAPGLGLVLDRLHYEAYNRRFGTDGMHEKIDWDEYQEQIDRFVDSHIYPTIYNTEKEDKSMIKWLATLPLHHYNTHEGPFEATPLIQAHCLVQQQQAADAASAECAFKDEQLALVSNDTVTVSSDSCSGSVAAADVVAGRDNDVGENAGS